MLQRILTVAVLLLLLLTLPVLGQKGFLTPNEVDQVREVQEPLARIRLYLGFATQRLDQVRSLMARDRPGRSAEVRQLLEDYASIIEAIDTVSDDALKRRANLTEAPIVIVAGERKFLEQLEKIQSGAPRDLEMYDYELKEAIQTTNDSIDLANEDLGTRSQDLSAKASKEKKQVADVNAAERKPGADPAADKATAAATDATKPVRKPPTLYRPGENPNGPPQ